MIAQSTDLSRRAAERAIVDGEVKVNGEVVRVLGTKVNPAVDQVSFRGSPLKITETLYYLAYNKPRGVLVTKTDMRGRPTIWDKLERWKGILNSVGRLDFYSEGLILLTNDGAMLHKLTHPSHEIWKVYEVKVKGKVSEDEIEDLRRGVELEDGLTLPAKVSLVKSDRDESLLVIEIREGRKRQVRRMCKAVGHAVVSLKRTAVGPIKLGDLSKGQWRLLTKDEEDALKKAMRC